MTKFDQYARLRYVKTYVNSEPAVFDWNTIWLAATIHKTKAQTLQMNKSNVKLRKRNFIATTSGCLVYV